MSVRTYLPTLWRDLATKRPSGQPPLRRRTPRLEPLESRHMLSASVRSIDGSGNNVAHPDWGSVGVDMLRIAPAAYSDGMSSPAGADRPNPRAISNAVVAQAPGVDVINNRDLSAFIYAWGQFIDHDLDLMPTGTTPFNITVPDGDASFLPGDVIRLNRSATDPDTGTSRRNPAQQFNSITAFVDGSMVYGSDETRAFDLRAHSDGLLATSAGNLLPFNTFGLPNANDAHIVADDELFLAGDVRANENVELTALHTLFVREHNRQAELLKDSHPLWTDDQLYEGARAIVIAEIQSITYNEFLPALLGDNALTNYRGYKPRVNPGITNEFATAAYRFGHSAVGNDVEFMDNNGEEVADEMSFAKVFFNPPVVQQTGIDPILKYLASDQMQEVDNTIVDPLRNFLFGPPGAGGMDLASLNIQRGRDNGLASYNDTRVELGLRPARTFADITKDPVVQAQLQGVYGTVDKVDLWVGGLAEAHVNGGSIGQTFTKIIADQFQRLRDGDRFFYLNQFRGAQLAAIQNTTLADIIRLNSGTTNLQENVFFFRTVISGTVFNDVNGNGRQNSREAGVGGVTVQLVDLDDNVIATAVTARDGSYKFADTGLGTYRVQLIVPDGMHLTASPLDIDMTRGQRVVNANFGVVGKALPVRPIIALVAELADAALSGGI